MFDVSRLSADSQAKLATIAAKDGNAANLSGDDIRGASRVELSALVRSLKQDGFDGNEQDLVALIVDLTHDQASLQADGTYQAYDFASGTITFELPTSASDAGPPPSTSQLGNKDVIAALYSESSINKTDWASGTGNKLDIGYIRNRGHIDEAAAARKKLGADFYTFTPSNPHDLNEVKAFASQLNPEQIPDFIHTYLTAYFEHPGVDTVWDASLNQKGAETVFFGNPPKLDQLPDGRYLVDCQGFAKLGEMLFQALSPGPESPTHFYQPLRVPGHEMGLMRDGDRVAIVDNNKVTELKLSASELANLSEYLDPANDCVDSNGNTGKNPLDNAGLMRAKLPSLYAYLDTHHANLASGGLAFDQGDTLTDG